MTALKKFNPNPRHFLTPFEDMLDTIFEDSFPSISNELGPKIFGKSSYPKCDVISFKDKMQVEMEIPGIKKDDINIEITESGDKKYLTIYGKKSTKNEMEDSSGRYIHRELKKSSFERSFFIGDDLDHENIQAKFNDGILEITIPKVTIKEDEKISRTIQIE